MRHPEDEELLERALGKRSPETEEHLRQCEGCRHRLAAMEEDLARLESLDGARWDAPAPPLPVAKRPRPLGLLRAAAVLALVALGGAAGSRWLEEGRVQVVAYVPPAPPVRGLVPVACPAGDLAVRVDTLRQAD